MLKTNGTKRSIKKEQPAENMTPLKQLNNVEASNHNAIKPKNRIENTDKESKKNEKYKSFKILNNISTFQYRLW